MDYDEKEYILENRRERRVSEHERDESPGYHARNKAKNVVIAILALTTLFGAYQYHRAVLLRRQLDAQYNRAFYEMTGYVQDMEVLLSKAMLTSSPQKAADILKDIWHRAELVSTNLGQLPVQQGALVNTQKFISQVGDYAKTLNGQNVKGQVMNQDQMDTIKSLHQYAVSLNDNLDKFHGELSAGTMKWENLAGGGAKLFSKSDVEVPMSISNIDGTFEEMPTLIYDGPFSEHMTNQKALGLSGENVSEDQAIENLGKLFGKENIRNIQKVSDNKNGVIDTYNFSFELEGKKEKSVAEADVSVVGGRVVWFLYNRDVGDVELDIDKAKEIGKQFLEKSGFKNMRDTYYTEQQGVATINYAYEQDGVTVYADLIKVKVALDNGEIVGFESKGYLMSHRERDIPTPVLSEAEALRKVARKENIVSTGLAIIPTDYGSELFCYEFKGKLDDQDFLVYINAITGEEEDILLIINSEEGILTM
jgi:spore germination protein